MQPEKFRVPYIAKEKIWAEADKLRNRFPRYAGPPVDVLKLAEFGLEIEFDLKSLTGLDTVALLMRDLKTIVVDKDAFINGWEENRLRFSVAHELGHLTLHPQLYGDLNFKSPELWKEFIGRIPAKEYGQVEWQAYEFAGRFLVPREKLSAMNDEVTQLAKDEGYWEPDETRTMAFEFISKTIAPEFKVSRNVIEKRLISEGFWSKSE